MTAFPPSEGRRHRDKPAAGQAADSASPSVGPDDRQQGKRGGLATSDVTSKRAMPEPRDPKPLACEMKMRTCELFWRRVQVQLACSSGSSFESFSSDSAVLRVYRRHRKCLGRAPLDITLDRRVHPVRLLPVSTRDVRKLEFGVEFGWRSRRVWFRAPDPEVYEQWGTALRFALLGFGGSHGGGEPAIANYGEHSEVSTIMTATTTQYDDSERASADSYMREGSSDSFRSEIPDDEWSDEDRPEIYELHHSEILEFAAIKHSSQDSRVYGGKGGAVKKRPRTASYRNDRRHCSRRNAVERSARFLPVH